MTLNSCFFCGHCEQKFDAIFLKMMLGSPNICKDCKMKVETALAKLKSKPVEPTIDVKKVERFLPPIPEKEFKNFQDREPNRGELIE